MATRDLKCPNRITWFNSKPNKKTADGLEPIKYKCEPKYIYTN